MVPYFYAQFFRLYDIEYDFIILKDMSNFMLWFSFLVDFVLMRLFLIKWRVKQSDNAVVMKPMSVFELLLEMQSSIGHWNASASIWSLIFVVSFVVITLEFLVFAINIKCYLFIFIH